MKVDICDIAKFIKVNNIEEVTNPVTFNQGFYPTDDGILSYKIFGISGSYDRKTLFGYIDLKKHFFHPMLYKMIREMDRRIVKIIDGSAYYIINKSGELVEDNENGHTGIEWLYTNFDKIKFKTTDSNLRNKKITILNSMKKDEIFVRYWLVIPASLRDVNLSNLGDGKPSLDKLNDHYISLLSLCKSNTSEFNFMGHLTEAKIQNKIMDIYENLIANVGGGTVHAEGVTKRGKEALFKKSLLGRSVDYSVRSVISAGRISCNNPDDQIVKYSYTGIPLSNLCTLFFPFFQYRIRVWAEEVFSTINEIKSATKKDVYYKLVDPMSRFTPDKIKKMISLFIKSPENRFDTIKIDVADENGKQFELDLNIYQDDLHRPFLLLDLMYITAVDVIKGKHVYLTRYPMERFGNIFPSRIKILTTYKTQSITIGSTYFPDYPTIEASYDSPNAKNAASFIDTVIPHNSTLKALGADFDGDTVALRSVYSQEANMEAERKIESMTNVVNGMTDNMRLLQNEGTQTIYTLTRNEDNPKKYRAITNEETEYLLGLTQNDISLDLLKELFADTKDRKKKFNPTDQMILQPNDFHNKTKIITTVGRYILNLFLFSGPIIESLGYVNDVLDNDGYESIDGKIVRLTFDKKMDVKELYAYFDRITWLGYAPCSFLIPSMSSNMYIIDKDVKKLKDKLVEENKEKILNGDVLTVNEIENQLIKLSKEKVKDEEGMQIYDSGARGSFKNNYKNTVLCRGCVMNFTDPSKFDASMNSLVEGIPKEELHIYANILTAGVYARSKSTEKGGYLVKQSNSAFQHIMLDENGSDCKTKKTLEITLTDKTGKLFIDRVMVDKNGKESYITKENLKDLIGKKIKVRSPLYCKGDKICSKCAGQLYYKMGVNNIGMLCSIPASTLMMLSMKAFHDSSIKVSKLNIDEYIKPL